MLKKIIVTGGDGRFAQELKKSKNKQEAILEYKKTVLRTVGCLLNGLFCVLIEDHNALFVSSCEQKNNKRTKVTILLNHLSLFSYCFVLL